ncbi:modification methylase [Candidatus Saccharibacteria bacterium]|nr:modification methylase [Candidatus Saccharibacteria bacterium]
MSSEEVIEVEHLPLKIENGATYSIVQANPNNYTHGMFKYPCKFIPEIPRWGIKKYSHKNTVVFDPFAGSGTSLLEANIHGYNALGTEIDDVAILLTKVKTKKLSKKQIKELKKIQEELLQRFSRNTQSKFRPVISNLSHWFSDDAINKLGLIRDEIKAQADIDIADFLKVVLVSIIKKVSYADDASPKPYVSNNIKKVPPSVDSCFANTYSRYIKMVEELNKIRALGSSEIIGKSALNFSLPHKTNLAITSPPYINAFDYGRIMRLENIWLDFNDETSLRNKKKSYIGTEIIGRDFEPKHSDILKRSDLLKKYVSTIDKVDKKRALIVEKFFDDMLQNIQCVHDNLCDRGKYMIVIGNSNIRKQEIESWRVLEQLAKSIGMKTDSYFSYIIKNPYIRIPRSGKGGKIAKDYIIVMEK